MERRSRAIDSARDLCVAQQTNTIATELKRASSSASSQPARKDNTVMTTATEDRLESARESRLRRKARRQGLRLAKSRSRTPEHHDWQTFCLVDARNNFVVASAGWTTYGLSLDEVESWLSE
jgi:hypothetical protein